MKTYIYTVQPFSTRRGFNRTISVYRLKNNQPIYIGYDDEIDTASYKGDESIAANIVNKHDRHKLMPGGYRLRSDNIRLIEV